MAIAGVDILLKVNTGTKEVPVWTVVAGQRSATLKMTTESINVTSKTNYGWADTIPSVRSWSIEGEGLIEIGDAGFEVLENAFFNRKQVTCQIAMPSGLNYKGLSTLKDFSYNMNHDSEATASFTLEGSGALEKATA